MPLAKPDKIKLAILFFGGMIINFTFSTYGIYPISLISMIMSGLILVSYTLLSGLVVYGVIRLFHKPKKERHLLQHALHYGIYFIIISTILSLPSILKMLDGYHEAMKPYYK